MSVVSIASLSGSILNPFIGSWLILTSNIIYSTALVLAFLYLAMLSQGTGLGLYISKSIIEAHGGRIWAENRKDNTGSTFIFTLPKVNEDLAGGLGENHR